MQADVEQVNKRERALHRICPQPESGPPGHDPSRPFGQLRHVLRSGLFRRSACTAKDHPAASNDAVPSNSPRRRSHQTVGLIWSAMAKVFDVIVVGVAPPRPKRATMPKPRSKPWRPAPNQMASGKPGAVQPGAVHEPPGELPYRAASPAPDLFGSFQPMQLLARLARSEWYGCIDDSLS
jgi:hypothetical protein